MHVNENAENLRHRFVKHEGRQEIRVTRLDFLPGRDNPWPEVFEEFSEQVVGRTGGLASLVQADFSTTAPVERAVSHLMAMDTFKSYFEYIGQFGCGIPRITLTGTSDDWHKVRVRAQRFADYGLEDWIAASIRFLLSLSRRRAQADIEFWKSMFRYNSGSGPAVMTGWANVLFPYLKHRDDTLYKNPYLADWQQRLAIDDQQCGRDRWEDPQGVGIGAVPSCVTSVPLKVFWGAEETQMRLVGGLMGVTQDDQTLAVAPECGWAVIYEEPVDPLSPAHERFEKCKQLRQKS